MSAFAAAQAVEESARVPFERWLDLAVRHGFGEFTPKSWFRWNDKQSQLRFGDYGLLFRDRSVKSLEVKHDTHAASTGNVALELFSNFPVRGGWLCHGRPDWTAWHIVGGGSVLLLKTSKLVLFAQEHLVRILSDAKEQKAYSQKNRTVFSPIPLSALAPFGALLRIPEPQTPPPENANPQGEGNAHQPSTEGARHVQAYQPSTFQSRPTFGGAK